LPENVRRALRWVASTRRVGTPKAERLVIAGFNIFAGARDADQNLGARFLFHPLPCRVPKCFPGLGHDVVLFVFHALN